MLQPIAYTVLTLQPIAYTVLTLKPIAYTVSTALNRQCVSFIAVLSKVAVTGCSGGSSLSTR